MIKLDYSIEDPEKRKELVEQILAETPEPTEQYLQSLADYLVFCMEKQEKREKRILTDNRLTTVNKRETSFENLVSQFENGEDGVYNLISNNKNVIFQPKVKITQEDLDEIPELKQLREAIEIWVQKMKSESGRSAYIIKKTLIELRKDQYIVKNAYRKPITPMNLTRNNFPEELPYKEWIDENGNPRNSGISLMNPVVCQTILCNYSRLKQDSYYELEGNTRYLVQVFEETCDRALEKYPLYQRLLEYKIDGKQNLEIQALIEGEFEVRHSVEYLSSLWRKKIPRLIAEQAELDYLNWYYTYVEKGKYKRCSRCGQWKLAHNKYFSKNKTSKDTFYSICKECRNDKTFNFGQFPVIDPAELQE